MIGFTRTMNPHLFIVEYQVERLTKAERSIEFRIRVSSRIVGSSGSQVHR